MSPYYKKLKLVNYSGRTFNSLSTAKKSEKLKRGDEEVRDAKRSKIQLPQIN